MKILRLLLLPVVVLLWLVGWVAYVVGARKEEASG
jgi:hypothetical protein